MEFRKNNLLSDAQTAIGIFRDIRKARKTGQTIKAGQVIKVGQTIKAGQVIKAGQTIKAGQVIKAGQTIKAGQAVKDESTILIPLIRSGAGIYDTTEGCTLSACNREIVEASRKAFNNLPPDKRHLLAFVPEDGEFIERALFWKELLAPVMTSKNCHIAMIKIIDWYIHIKKMRSTPADQERTSGGQNDIGQETPVHTIQKDLKLELPVHTFRTVT